MADELIEEFPLAEDWEPEYALWRKNTNTRKKEAAAGLTGVNAWLSATEDGATINAAVSVTLTEAASLPGTYFGLVEKANLASHLTAYLGQTVYKVVDKTNDFRVSTPVKVVAIRTV